MLLAGREAFVPGKAFSLNTASGACTQEILLRASAKQLPFGCPRTLLQPTVVVAEGSGPIFITLSYLLIPVHLIVILHTSNSKVAAAFTNFVLHRGLEIVC